MSEHRDTAVRGTQADRACREAVERAAPDRPLQSTWPRMGQLEALGLNTCPGA